MRRSRIILAVFLAGVAFSAPAAAQTQPSTPTPASKPTPEPETVEPREIKLDNPITTVEEATEGLGIEGGLSSAINIMILLTVLTLAPSILILTTCFVRIVVVLALLRQAIGAQGLPPTQVITGLALFMTFLIMAPTFEKINEVAIQPMAQGEIQQDIAWSRAKGPLREFMFDQIDATGNTGDIYMIMNYRGVDTSEPESLKRKDVDLLTLVPAFVLSELKTAFLIGFRIYLPFLIIDMVVASLLISMGMLMLPPSLISLPFKILLFVLVDGWRLVVGNLLDSFAQPEATTTTMLLLGWVT